MSYSYGQEFWQWHKVHHALCLFSFCLDYYYYYYFTRFYDLVKNNHKDVIS